MMSFLMSGPQQGRRISVRDVEGETRLLELDNIAAALGLDITAVEAAMKNPETARFFHRNIDVLSAVLHRVHEERIDTVVGALLAADPAATVEAKIDMDNARMRAEFLREFRCFTSADLHNLSHSASQNLSHPAHRWKAKGLIFAISHAGRDLYPAFQFDAEARPLPQVGKVLAELPGDLTPWQTAFWFVSPNSHLEGRLPAECLSDRDPDLAGAARRAYEMPVG